MKNIYRINARFDLDDPKEKAAADYLTGLNLDGHRLRNRFIVDAVCEAVRRKTAVCDCSADDIREIFRDEFGRAFMAFSGGSIQPLPFTPDADDVCQEEIDAAVLDDLSMFGC